MNQSSQNKVMSAGFKIIRADDYPSPRIKIKKAGQMEWSTLEKFETKAARNRKMQELLKSDYIIED